MMTRYTILLLLLAFACGAHADITGSELLDGYALSDAEKQQLEDGDVLAISDGEFEFSKRELAADAMIIVRTDHQTVLDSLEDEATLIPVKYLIENRMVTSDSDFDDVSFTAEEFDEVEKLFGNRLGKDFNLSAAEQATVREVLAPYRKASNREKLEAAAEAMRVVLKGRLEAYQAKGLNGIAAYDRSKRKQVDVGAELRTTNDANAAFKDDFPEFVHLLSNYPDGAECCIHEYRWLKVELHKRPAFALSHTMIQSADDFAVIAERYFYVTNSLNSVQISVLWVPYEDGGSVGLAVSASADILDSMLGRMLRPVGRNKAVDLVTDAMTDIRNEFEAPPAEEAPVEEAPVEETPAEEVPVEDSPAEESPVEESQ